MQLKNIVKEIKYILENDTSLAFVKNAGGIHIGKDIYKLIQGKHPWINIDINPDTLKIVDADNLRTYDAVREVYKIDITMSVSHKDKYISVYGQDEITNEGVITQVYIPGIIDLNEIVWNILSENPSLNDKVEGIYDDISIETDVLEPLGDGLLYKAGARMSIAYFIENLKR